MAQDIFIGIDGGASKCKVRVEDAAGNLIGQAVGDPANIRLSVDNTWHSIYQTLEEILKPQHISLHDKQYQFHVGMGLAGCEMIEAKQDFLSRAHPFSTLQLISDAHIACLGAHSGKDGAIIIIGTGVVGYQIQAGVRSIVGGWGFPHDDEGGGAWLGLEATRLTLQFLDQRIASTPMLEAIFAFFNRDQAYLIAWANKANSSEFARLAPLVIEHSQLNDAGAICLMQTAAGAINLIAYALEKKQVEKTQPLACSLFGGVAPFIEPWLGRELRARLKPQDSDANAGAILMIRDAVKKRC